MSAAQRRASRSGRWLLAVSVLALASACTGSAASGPPTPSQRVAALAACPPPAAATTAQHPLPALTLPCLGSRGGPVALRTLTGTPTVLNLYASWCAPCQRELPGFADYATKAAGRVAVIGVDTKDEARSAGGLLGAVGVHYPSVYDEDGSLFNALNAAGLPMTVVVDGSGQIVAVRRAPLSEPELALLVADSVGVRVPV